MRFRTVQRFALFCVSLLLAAAVHAQAVTTEMTPGREGVPVEDTARPAVDTEPGGTAISNPVPNDTTREDVLFDGGELSGQASFTASTLPHDLSPWGMFMQADRVVKAVMIGLALASLVTWTVLVAKTREIGTLIRLQKQTLATLNQAGTLKAAQSELAKGKGQTALIDAAAHELQLSADALADVEGVKERVASSLERLEAANSRRATRGTGVLATIGSTAPFVGLFGTVWGIMNSFIGISKAQTTNLAVVAPGIAEALLATALGLVAAIPAVVIYNHFARRIAAYKALVGDTSAAILRLVSRDLSRLVVAGNHNERSE